MTSRAGSALEDRERLRGRVMETLAGDDCERVQPSLLQPADDILSHYGEEIRARACVLSDAHGGELFLVPDYTVPVCRMHLERGGGAGRYVYAGPVFRMPAPGQGEAPVEEEQAGIEVYGEAEGVQAEAMVMRRTMDALKAAGALGVEVTVGDVGLGRAALETVAMPDQRRERLRRRIGQPARFHELMQRYIGIQAEQLPPEREDLLERFAGVEDEEAGEMAAAVLEERGIPHLGQRTLEDIGARLATLAAERYEPPLDVEDAARINEILSLRDSYPRAVEWLKAREEASSPGVASVIETLERRAEAMDKAGVDLAGMLLDARFVGELGYYDGFVFSARASNLPVAGGGRYDGLPKALGGSGSAVGAAIWTGRLAQRPMGSESP